MLRIFRPLARPAIAVLAIFAALAIVAALALGAAPAQAAPHGGSDEAAIEARIDAIVAGIGGPGYAPPRETLRWLLTGDHAGPFHMLNLLKFRDAALYPDGRANAGTGLEAQGRYGAAMAPMTRELGVTPLVVNRIAATAIAETADDDWDMFTVVYYPDVATLLRMIEDPRYAAAVVHKKAALAKTLSVITLPGGQVVTPPAAQ